MALRTTSLTSFSAIVKNIHIITSRRYETTTVIPLSLLATVVSSRASVLLNGTRQLRSQTAHNISVGPSSLVLLLGRSLSTSLVGRWWSRRLLVIGAEIETLLLLRWRLLTIVLVVRRRMPPSAMVLLLRAVSTLLVAAVLRRTAVLVALGSALLLLVLVVLLRGALHLMLLLLMLVRRIAITTALTLVLPLRPVVASILLRRRAATLLPHEWILHLWLRTMLKAFRSRFHGTPSSRTSLIQITSLPISLCNIPFILANVHASVP